MNAPRCVSAALPLRAAYINFRTLKIEYSKPAGGHKLEETRKNNSGSTNQNHPRRLHSNPKSR
jgi:hypothetical protein